METRPGRPGRRGLGGGRGGGWGSRTLRPRSRHGLLASIPTSSGGAWRRAPGAESRAIYEAARGPVRDARHCCRREPQRPLRATGCRASRDPARSRLSEARAIPAAFAPPRQPAAPRFREDDFRPLSEPEFERAGSPCVNILRGAY